MRRHRARSWAATAAIVAVGCTVPDLDFANKKCLNAADCGPGQVCASDGTCASPPSPDAGGDGAPPDAASDGAPPDGSAPVDVCKTIPRFLGAQTVDGLDGDFVGVPTQSLRWSDLVQIPAVIGDKIDLDARVAWSDQGLHMFFHVHYESGSVVVPIGSDPLWYGDAIEVFVKGDANLTGRYDGMQDTGALQIVAVPDDGTAPRSQTYVNQGFTTLGSLPAGAVATHRDGDGYDLEFFIAWPLVQGAPMSPPVASSHIGFDVALDYRTRSPEAGADNVQYQLLLKLAAVPDLTANCPSNAPIPACDDRTWCVPQLAP